MGELWERNWRSPGYRRLYTTRPPFVERSRGTSLGHVELRGGRAARGTWGVRGLLAPDYIRRDQTTHIVWTQIVLLFTFPPSPLSPLSSAPPPPTNSRIKHHNPHVLPAHREQGSVSNLTTPWKIFWLMRCSYARMATLIE